MNLFQFPVFVEAESYTDAVAILKAWRGGELNDSEAVTVGPPEMTDVDLWGAPHGG